MPLVKITIAEAHKYYNIDEINLSSSRNVTCPNCNHQRELNKSDIVVIETGSAIGKPSVILYKCPHCGEDVVVLFFFLYWRETAELQISRVVPFINNRSWEILAGKREIYGIDHSAKYKVAYANYVIRNINEWIAELNITRTPLVKTILKIAYSLTIMHSFGASTIAKLHALFEKFVAEQFPYASTEVEKSLYNYALFGGASTSVISGYNDEINEIFKGL